MDSDTETDESHIKSSVPSIASGSSSPSYISKSSSGHGCTPAPWYRLTFRTYVLIILPLLSVLGAFGTWTLANSNGTFEILRSIIAPEGALFPGLENENAALLKKYTGFKVVDYQLTILVTFFAPILGQCGEGAGGFDVSLFALEGFGQFGGVWTIMMMESLRVGNKGRVVSYIGLAGILVQNFTYTVTTPLWLLLHLLTSPVAKPFPGTHANSVLLIPSLDLKILPVAVSLGYILPSLLMALPAPSVVSPDAHQKYIAIWQAFPVWIVLIHHSLKYICRKASFALVSPDEGGKGKTTPQGASYLSNAKYVYIFVIGLCMITHFPVLLLTLIPSHTVPTSFPLLTKLSTSTPASVFLPYFPLLSYKVSSFAEGIHTFLVWDIWVGSIALLLWAVLLHRNATTEKTIVDPNTSLPIYRELLLGEKRQGFVWGKMVGKLVVWWVLAGPGGALAVLLWERDAVVRQKIKQGI